MVSSGTVKSDEATFSTLLSSYDSQIAGLSGSWMGQSHDAIAASAEAFSSEFSSAIKSQMDIFANACTLYEQYKVAKTSLMISQNNYNAAVSNNDASSAAKFQSSIKAYTDKMNLLKNQIQSLLSSAASSSLSASGSSGSVSGVAVGSGTTGTSSSGSVSDNFTNYYQYNYHQPYYSGKTIASAGCGTTSMAMVLTSLTGKSVDPVETTNYSLKHGTYVVGQGTSWDYFGKISKDYGINCTESHVSSDNIKNGLNNNKKIIMSMKPGTFTKSGHFIVLKSMNPDGTINVADPNSEKRSNTTYGMNIFLDEGKEMWTFG